MAHAREIGFATVAERGVRVADELDRNLVYAGMWMGVMPAQQLAQTRPDARGGLFFHGCLFAEEFGEGWPQGLRVQIHGMDDDPFFAEEGGDLDAARALVASADDVELFLYPGDAHLFTDASLSAHDPAATDQVVQRVLAFLDRHA